MPTEFQCEDLQYCIPKEFYCDGSHNKFNEANGTNFSPMEMNAEKHGGDTIYVCRCGQSGKRKQGSPACDGTHRRLAAK